MTCSSKDSIVADWAENKTNEMSRIFHIFQYFHMNNIFHWGTSTYLASIFWIYLCRAFGPAKLESTLMPVVLLASTSQEHVVQFSPSMSSACPAEFVPSSASHRIALKVWHAWKPLGYIKSPHKCHITLSISPCLVVFAFIHIYTYIYMYIHIWM